MFYVYLFPANIQLRHIGQSEQAMPLMKILPSTNISFLKAAQFTIYVNWACTPRLESNRPTVLGSTKYNLNEATRNVNNYMSHIFKIKRSSRFGTSFLVARGGFGLRSASVGAKQTSPGRLALRSASVGPKPRSTGPRGPLDTTP